MSRTPEELLRIRYIILGKNMEAFEARGLKFQPLPYASYNSIMDSAKAHPSRVSSDEALEKRST